MKTLVITFIGLLCYATGISQNRNAVLIETESFDKKGGWFIDQQSMDVMGSPYLLAHGRDSLFRTRPGSIIINGDWKLHQYFEDGGLELYNLKEDLGERNNLAQTNPEKTEELLEYLDNWRKEINAPIPTEPNPEFDSSFVPK